MEKRDGILSRGRPGPRPPQRPADGQGLAARVVATALLAAVIDRRQPLDLALEVDAGFAGLSPRDRAFVRAILGTALRRKGTIASILDKLVARRPPRAGQFFRILEIAAAQILFLEVADHAAVSLAVDQIAADHNAQHFKGLANAVLRRMVRERDALLAGAPPRLDTPDWLWARWSATYGEATAAKIAAALVVEPGLDLSVKSDPAAWAERLGGIVLPTGSVRLVPSGPIEDMAGFAEGAWWVQDAAAALPARLLGDVAGKRVADLCAAPGGKTAELASAGAIVTAVDISASRLARVRANLARLGLAAETIAADIFDWRPDAPFDAVLLDAPCTATGTIRRHPDVAWLKREADVATLAALQARMIERAVSLLKPGGTLVYCTCSLEPEEGEDHVRGVIARLPLTLLPVAAGEIGGLAELIAPGGWLRTLPCHLPHATPRLSGLDGFFVVRLRKG